MGSMLAVRVVSWRGNIISTPDSCEVVPDFVTVGALESIGVRRVQYIVHSDISYVESGHIENVVVGSFSLGADPVLVCCSAFPISSA